MSSIAFFWTKLILVRVVICDQVLALAAGLLIRGKGSLWSYDEGQQNANDERTDRDGKFSCWGSGFFFC